LEAKEQLDIPFTLVGERGGFEERKNVEEIKKMENMNSA